MDSSNALLVVLFFMLLFYLSNKQSVVQQYYVPQYVPQYTRPYRPFNRYNHHTRRNHSDRVILGGDPKTWGPQPI